MKTKPLPFPGIEMNNQRHLSMKHAIPWQRDYEKGLRMKHKQKLYS